MKISKYWNQPVQSMETRPISIKLPKSTWAKLDAMIEEGKASGGNPSIAGAVQRFLTIQAAQMTASQKREGDH